MAAIDTNEPSSLESLRSLPPDDPSSLVVGSDPAVNRVAHHAQRAAQVECTVLITGETGTGKRNLGPNAASARPPT